MSISKVLTQIDEEFSQSTDRLFELLRIESISTDSNYDAECEKAADWLVSELSDIGFEASKRATLGHPMVIAHSNGPGSKIMFYGVPINTQFVEISYPIQTINSPTNATNQPIKTLINRKSSNFVRKSHWIWG